MKSSTTKTEFKLIEELIENKRLSHYRYDDDYYDELFEKNEKEDHSANVKFGFFEYALVKSRTVDGVSKPFSFSVPVNFFKLFTEGEDGEVLNENIEKGFSIRFADRFLAYSTFASGVRDSDKEVTFCPVILCQDLKNVDRYKRRVDNNGYFDDREPISHVHIVDQSRHLYWFDEIPSSQTVHGIEDLNLKPSYRPYKITKITVNDDGTAIFHPQSNSFTNLKFKTFEISFRKHEFVPFFANVSKNVQTGELVCAFSFSKFYDELKLTTWKEWGEIIVRQE